MAGEKRKELKEAARAVLGKRRWSEEVIGRALDPTLAQAAERGLISIKGIELNPERQAAVEILRGQGWSIPEIAGALGVSERTLSRALSVIRQVREMLAREFGSGQEGDGGP